jgi:hypothetical protein
MFGGLCVGMIGGLFMLLGLWLSSRRAWVKLRGLRATATVVEVTPFARAGSPIVRPKLRYTDVNGREQEVLYSEGVSVREGEQVPIFYLPSRPDRVLIDMPGQGWAGPLMFVVFGGVLAGIGVAMSFGWMGEGTWFPQLDTQRRP